MALAPIQEAARFRIGQRLSYDNGTLQPPSLCDIHVVFILYAIEYIGRISRRGRTEKSFFRDGHFGVGSGPSKSWMEREDVHLKLLCEVFNVTNSVRFDTRSLNNDASSGGFGARTENLTMPRIQQFSLRFSF